MVREGKGTNVNKHVNDYCVMDLETTSKFIQSAKIIEIGLLRVRNGKVVEEFNKLVNPRIKIPYGATLVNHITNEMVASAGDIDDIIDEAISFIGTDIVVGYNNASYDMNIVYDVYKELRGLFFVNDYIDVKHVAMRSLTDIDNYKLETICNYYRLDTSGEHRALKDCYLTKECYDKLFSEYGNDVFISRSDKSGKSHSSRKQYSQETLALQELHALVQTIIEDGEITSIELTQLSSWVEEHIELQGYYPFDRIFDALDEIFKDGKVSPEEIEELKSLLIDFVDPVKSRCCHDSICSITGKHVCITGDFEYGSRENVFSLIEEAGGIVDKNVKKATNFIVVGAKGSENWKTGNYGGKIQKALEMNEKGADIIFVEENDFISSVKCIIENRDTSDMTKDLNPIDWKQEVRDMLEELINEYELPSGSLYLSDSYGQSAKTKDNIISHSVWIWEPDFPPMPNERRGQNRLVVTIVPSTVKSRPDDLDLKIRELQEGDLHQYLPKDAEMLTRTKSDISADIVRIRIPKTSLDLVEYIKLNTIYCIKGYTSKAARFGCCSQFNKCSDAKKCVHVNKLYSKACIYRDHLEHGRIFYGKNRNVD